MNDAAAIELLERLVRTPSVSGDEARIAALLAEVLPRFGFAARVDEVGNLVASVGEGEDLGVLLGHIDTVPGEIPVRREGSILHGRGAVDAKGPFATFIAALARLDAPSLPGRLTLIGCVEEEAPSSRGARHVVDRHRPRFCIVGEPSGWDAVTLGYKGHLAARVLVEVDGAHGAHEAATAAEQACALHHALATERDAWNEDRRRLFDQLFLRLRRITSGSAAGDRERAELGLELRLPPDLPPDAARAWLRDRLPDDEGIRLESEGGVPAWSGPRTTPLHRHLLGAIRRRDGAGRCLLKTGTADLNIVAPEWGCPALAYGPGDSALDHTPHEHLDLRDFVRAIAVLEEALVGLVASLSSEPRARPASSCG